MKKNTTILIRRDAVIAIARSEGDFYMEKFVEGENRPGPKFIVF